MFKGFKWRRDAINFYFRHIILAAMQSLEMNKAEGRGREISWMAFPVNWVRKNFLVPEYFRNSAIR